MSVHPGKSQQSPTSVQFLCAATSFVETLPLG
eukprot:CAMPEP_0170619756 /NCGR_PEP_ID=MMETSP0224-20130122/27685_1 /TAXON_ID=285029 /ORGANISM="Togula jolla, Strain CCCM 725" /LENGTH=31 /DNA_ID= /DNA_START= /DNA_END= /DNA_ORIENTATION=